MQKNSLSHSLEEITYTELTNKHFQIILASASPRRRQLLTQAGYDFKVIVPDVDESAFSSEQINPCDYAEKLALAKARSVAVKFPDNIVLGADTIVDFNGLIIGKAVDAKEAEQITRKLFSRPHKVITAVAIVVGNRDIEMVQSDTTVVYPKKLSDQQIIAHIESQRWQDKAGAYAIQESGDQFVEKIDGSLTNVMGLPMELLRKMLRNTESASQT